MPARQNKTRWGSAGWAVLALGLFLLGAAVVGRYQHQHNQQIIAERLAELSRKASTSLQRRFELYQYGLRGARGAVIGASGRGITAQEFARYAESRDIAAEFPGARGFGFIARVPQDGEAAFVARARADGLPGFAIHQLAPHKGERFVIKFIEPLATNEAALGLDIASQASRRSAAVAAMASGNVALTAPITLVQATGVTNRSMLILMPVYRGSQHPPAARRIQDCIGWVYAPLVTDDILTSLDETNSDYGFRLSDVTDPLKPTLFFASHQQDVQGQPSHLRRFVVYGRVWQVEIQARPAFIAALGLSSSLWVSGVVAAIGALLATLLLVLLNLQLRKQRSYAQQARLAAIVESSYDAVIGTTLDGRITEWNRAATQIFGYAAEAVLGTHLADMIVPARHLAGHKAMVETVCGGGNVAAFETIRRHESGRPLEVEVSAAPIRDGRGRVSGIALTVRDIHERKDAERRVLEANSTLEQQVQERTAELQAFSSLQRAILANAGYAIIATDPDGIITLFNPAAESMLGYRSEELVGLATPERFHDREEVAARAAWLREELGRPVRPGFEVFVAKARDKPDVHEWTYITRDGQRVPVLINVSSLYRSDGEVLGYLGIAVDLRERKKREAALAVNERKLRGLFELSPLGIALTDERGQFVEFNEAFCQLTGYSDAELRSIDYWKLTPPEYEPKERAVLSIIEQTGRYGPYEKEYVRANGERTPVRLNGVRLEMDGRPYLWSIAEDITLQRMTESAMVDAVAAAEAASAAKSNFLANMSHEIRTPMNAILGMLQLLQRTALDERQHDYCSKTENAARTLLAILNDILDFSKIEAGRQTLESTTFDVESVFRDIGVILGGNVGDKNIEVVFDIDHRMPALLVGDSLRLRQVLINLAGNAVKFTHVGEVVLSARLAAQLDRSIRVYFEVRDTGIGIDADKLESIFEGFSQAEASTTRRFGGTGLGLAISRRLVALMGGELRVESEPGRGSRFHFSVELGVPADTWSVPDGLSPATAAPLRVLAVDDNASAREVLATMGEALGWQVDVAESGEQALQQLTRSLALRQPYDVILVDWHMPGIDGWETSQRIRDMSPDAAPLIVMVTAHGRDALAERTAREGALLDGFLTKPVTASMLLDAVADARAHRPPAAGPAARRAAPEALASVRRLEKMRVLVVEDNPTNQQVVTELLQGEGALVEVVGGGHAALERLSGDGKICDAVLMDIQMPDMDGYTATRRIRALPDRARLPIIAMTANVMPSDRQACLDAGMNDHIGKPFDLDDLVARLRHWTGRSAALAQSIPRLDGSARPGADARPAGALDRDGALSRMGGNERLYASTLAAFPESATALLDGLDRARADASKSDALRQLHTLKGLAGSVGAQGLAHAAAAQERAVHVVPVDWQSAINLDALRDMLAEVVAQIAPAAAPAADPAAATDHPATATTSGHAPVTRAQMKSLMALLQASNLQSLDVYLAMSPAMAARHPGTHQRIEAALAAMDFPAALAACQRLMRHQQA
ncbi:PAS domain S-box protein [Dyella sp.]|jgi:PAS domain S-box-containing protein|uniref:PAS domain S-box protein n=1 Tax=Dyella sp. TaxID=1869338 RepID=UPI002D78738B|nr:PAS domain S-box protein [Dyella sp.]HET6430959.1 PAS domain S-box protein [Dyella sp.]